MQDTSKGRERLLLGICIGLAFALVLSLVTRRSQDGAQALLLSQQLDHGPGKHSAGMAMTRQSAWMPNWHCHSVDKQALFYDFFSASSELQALIFGCNMALPHCAHRLMLLLGMVACPSFCGVAITTTSCGSCLSRRPLMLRVQR